MACEWGPVRQGLCRRPLPTSPAWTLWTWGQTSSGAPFPANGAKAPCPSCATWTSRTTRCPEAGRGSALKQQGADRRLQRAHDQHSMCLGSWPAADGGVGGAADWDRASVGAGQRHGRHPIPVAQRQPLEGPAASEPQQVMVKPCSHQGVVHPAALRLRCSPLRLPQRIRQLSPGSALPDRDAAAWIKALQGMTPDPLSAGMRLVH